MMKGDYVLFKGEVAKITRVAKYYDVVDAQQHKTDNITLHQPNIIINENVLLACGFTQDVENKHIFTYHLADKDLIIIGDITFDLSPLNKICNIAFSIHADFMRISKQIIVLSELQDFIRINAGQELPINVELLAKAVQ